MLFCLSLSGLLSSVIIYTLHRLLSLPLHTSYVLSIPLSAHSPIFSLHNFPSIFSCYLPHSTFYLSSILTLVLSSLSNIFSFPFRLASPGTLVLPCRPRLIFLPKVIHCLVLFLKLFFFLFLSLLILPPPFVSHSITGSISPITRVPSSLLPSSPLSIHLFISLHPSPMSHPSTFFIISLPSAVFVLLFLTHITTN